MQNGLIWKFPYDAVREAWLNALIHRDYTSSSKVQIKVYDDRLVTSNPGGLQDGLIISDLLGAHRSVPRNPALAQIVYYTKLIEKWGTGTLRMRAACLAEGAPAPEFVSIDTSFTVILRKVRISEDKQEPLKAIKSRWLTPEETQVVELVRQAGSSGVSRATLVEVLGYSPEEAGVVLLRPKRRGELAQIGTRRWATYQLPQLPD